jgi:hypothetical protein
LPAAPPFVPDPVDKPAPPIPPLESPPAPIPPIPPFPPAPLELDELELDELALDELELDELELDEPIDGKHCVTWVCRLVVQLVGDEQLGSGKSGGFDAPPISPRLGYANATAVH